MRKDEIRSLVRACKARMDSSLLSQDAAKVFCLLERMTAFITARHVVMYHSLPDELSTHAFIDKWYKNKRIYLPRVNGAELEILPYCPSMMHPGAFGVEEPGGDDIECVSDMDLIVVPALALGTDGSRVGRGKGYYDRLLAGIRAVKVGVCYDFQLFDKNVIECEEHDVSMDYVITPSHFIKV